jgi:hypothetical protein
MSAAMNSIGCLPHCHVWRRGDREVGRRIPRAARCHCREFAFEHLPLGAHYRTEYRRSTGEVLLNYLSLKSDR